MIYKRGDVPVSSNDFFGGVTGHGEESTAGIDYGTVWLCGVRDNKGLLQRGESGFELLGYSREGSRFRS